MEAQKLINKVNGIDVDILQATVSNIQDDPDLAKCKFHIKNKWINANHNRSLISSFYGAKQEISHKETFELDADDMKVLNDLDEGFRVSWLFEEDRGISFESVCG